MQSILPDTAKLSVVTIKQKVSKRKGFNWEPGKPLPSPPPPIMVKFIYEETFTEESARAHGFSVSQLLDNTYAALKPHLKTLGIKFKRSGKRVQISGTIPREQFGNMMFSEFMGWSTIGNAPIRDLLMGTMIGASGVKMPHTVPSFPGSPALPKPR